MKQYNVTVQVIYTVLANSPEAAKTKCQAMNFELPRVPTGKDDIILNINPDKEGVVMVDWDYDVEEVINEAEQG